MQYYYSIKEVSIGGRCMCNGFADKCDEGTTFKCQCQHFTCGPNCDRCCDGYIQKKWQPRYKNENFICERRFHALFVYTKSFIVVRQIPFNIFVSHWFMIKAMNR